ncbi:Double-stranded RNA-binding protein 2 [Hibiscus syriacus]|uniref:Double-stranded RNA-binding protein 2 n=2 Tax=Hibiscus syriacus TaxID=106335 RepID=A0A6A2ZMG1_HIBSY|nr:double-stranded RNA-binding protein 2-like isoform X1 [Hibiscus syriacus]KAE8692910.1 Double-stranded RNA-binding protein 2 [Hibiscus syriacus]
MYKNQLQELAQRSCFNLPSYTCIREGPDHAPRFKATVNFNGETFESPHYCSTLRQAEHSAAEVALQSLSNSGPSHSLAARILDETGVYKNLLQEIAQRVGAPLPQYTTFRSGLGHLPIFTGTVDLAGIIFTGEPAKNKKQAEKNAAMAAWTSLKLLVKETASSLEPENNDELEQITIARVLLNYRINEKMAMANSSNGPILFTKKFPIQNPRPTSPQPPATTSKILPLICPKLVSRNRSKSATANDKPILTFSQTLVPESRGPHPQKFPAAGAAPYVPIRQLRTSCHGIAPPVTIRTAVPVFSAPPRPAPSAVSPQPPASAIPTHPAQSLLPAQTPQSVVPPHQSSSPLPTQVLRSPVRIAPPISIRQAVPVFAAPPVRKEDKQFIPIRNEDIATVIAP